ncbi:SIR2 family protein [Globicatella sulfidifaciens]
MDKINEDRILNDLVDSLYTGYKEQKLVVFIGAGVSISQGYPNWNQYVEHLIKYWQSYFLSERIGRSQYLFFDSLLQSNLSNKRKVDLVNNAIIKYKNKEWFEKNRLNFERLYFENLEPTLPFNEILEKLMDLEAIFITANYDLEIEKHKKRFGKIFRTINDLDSYFNTNDDLRTGDVLHIHGVSESKYSSFVSSSSDYARTYLKYTDSFIKLKNWFKEKSPTVLFIGVSMEEDEILSLLDHQGKNYTLLKNNNEMSSETNNEFNNIYENFMQSDFKTKVIWYGNAFKDLPKYIEKVTKNLNEKIKVSRNNLDWQILLSGNSDVDECFDAFSNNLNDFLFIEELYKQLLMEKNNQFIDKHLQLLFSKGIIDEPILNNTQSLWGFLLINSGKFENEWYSQIINRWVAQDIPYYFDAVYKIYHMLIEQKIIEYKDLQSIRQKLAKIDDIIRYQFKNDSKLMGYWLVEIFKGQKYVSLDESNFIQIELDDELINEMINCFEDDRRLKYTTIDELLHKEAFRYLERCFIEECILINNQPILENFPDNLLSNKTIQKILVNLDNNNLIKNEDLVIKLIKNIDFNNEYFGKELNQFVSNRKQLIHDQLIQVLEIYKDIISYSQSGFVSELSHIIEEDIINKSQIELYTILSEAKEFEPVGNISEFKEKTIRATIKYIIEYIKDRKNEYIKLITLFKTKENELFERYSKVYLDLSLVEDKSDSYQSQFQTIYIKHLNYNDFSFEYREFFQKVRDNTDKLPEDIKKNLFKFNFNNFKNQVAETEILEINKFINSKLGMYFETLINLSISDDISKKDVINIIDTTEVTNFKEFMQGVFIEEYVKSEVDISINTFLGYCYYHNGITHEYMKIFSQVVAETLNTNIAKLVDSDYVFSVLALIALNFLDPNTQQIDWDNNDFTNVLWQIFLNKKVLQYEEEWFNNIIERYPFAEVLSTIISDKRSVISKLSTYLDNLEKDSIRYSGNFKLHFLSYKFEIEDLGSDRKRLLSQLILILLEANKIEKSFYNYEELVNIAKLLSFQDANKLGNIIKQTDLLTPNQKEKFRCELNSILQEKSK